MTIQTTDILTGDIAPDVQEGVEALTASVNEELGSQVVDPNAQDFLESKAEETEVAGLWSELIKPVIKSATSQSDTIKKAPRIDEIEPSQPLKPMTVPGVEGEEAAARATFDAPETQQMVGTAPRIAGLRINLDDINTDDDFVMVLNQLNDASARETAKISHQQVLDDMAAEGWTIEQLSAILDPNKTLPGKTVTETLAKRAVVFKHFADDEALLRGKIVTAGGWDEAEPQLIKDYMKSQFLLAKAQSALQGYGSDIGRGLSLKNATWDQVKPAISNLDERVARIAPDDPDYQARLAFMMMEEAKGDNRKIAWLANMSAFGKRGMDMLWYNWHNSVLSGPDTLARIGVGNTLFTALRAIERPIAAAIGQARYGVQKLANVENPTRPISLYELAANLKTARSAWRDSFAIAAKSFRSERNFIGKSRTEVTKDGRNPFMFNHADDDSPMVKSGKIVSNMWGMASSVPNRGMIGLDDAARSFNMTVELRGLAARRADRVYHQALDAGESKAKALELRDKTFMDYVNYPDAKDVDEAVALANRLALTSEIESNYKYLEKLLTTTYPWKIAAPFARTIINGISTTAEYAPFGGALSHSYRKQLQGYGMSGEKGGRDAVNVDQALARFSMGMGMGWAFSELTESNFDPDAEWGVTGAMMYDPVERKMRMQRGEIPFAVWWKKSRFTPEQLTEMENNPRYKFSGDRVYQTYMGMEPASGILASWATIMEYNSRHEDADAADRFVALMGEATAAYMSNIPMFTQAGNFYDAVVFRPNDQSAMEAIGAETTTMLQDWALRGSGALNYDGLMRWVDQFTDEARYESTAPMEDYANMSPILRDVMDTLHQHQTQNPVWRHFYEDGITPKVDIMSGEYLAKEGSVPEKLIPGYMRIVKENKAWAPLWQMKLAAPTVPRHLEQVFLNGPQKQFWANQISNEPVLLWAENPMTKKYEPQGLAYQGLNMREKLASMVEDPEYLGYLATGTNDDYEKARDLIQDIVATAKRHANFALRMEYEDFDQQVRDKETEITDKRRQWLEQFGDKN